MKITWDDETCLRFAEAYDVESVLQVQAQRDREIGDEYADWAASRVACVRAGLGAVVLDQIKAWGEGVVK